MNPIGARGGLSLDTWGALAELPPAGAPVGGRTGGAEDELPPAGAKGTGWAFHMFKIIIAD